MNFHLRHFSREWRTCVLGFTLLGIVTLASAQTTFTHDSTGNRTVQTAVTTPVAPTIVAQPTNQLGQLGGTASFTVVAAGTGPFTYQWFENNAPISGATGGTLVLTNLQSGNFTNHADGTNSYTVTVTNSVTGVTSNPAALYLDTDNEGIPDWWQLQNFGTIGIAPLADADNDGVSNLQEYLDGTNPNDATSHNFALNLVGPVSVQPAMASYPAGTVVTLTVPPAPGAYFQNWSGDVTGHQNPLTITMDSNKNITAVTGGTVTPPTNPVLSAGGAGGLVGKLLLQGNGQILVAGSYHTLNGTPQWDLGRLNTDGTLDTTFFPGAGSELPFYTAGIAGASDMAQQADGKIIVVGFFDTSALSVPIPPGIYRVNTNGTLDTSYVASSNLYVETSAGTQANITSVALQTDGKVIIAGNFAFVGSTARAGIARLNTDGSLDTTFNPGTGFAQTTSSSNPLVSARCLKIAANGQIYAGGSFGTYNGVSSPGVVRLNTDGSLDTVFNVGTGAGPGTSIVTSLLVRSAGGVMVGGTFTQFNSVARPHLIALTNAGTVDSTFTGPSDINTITALAFQTNGQLIVNNGSFSENPLLRLNTNGSIDSTFSTELEGNRAVNSIVVQSNGKIVIGGNFTAVDTVPQINLARLNTDGTLDTTAVLNAGTLNPGQSNSGPPTCFAEQNDAKVLVGGAFTLFDNTNAGHLVRLNPDSSLDTTFNPGGVGFDGAVKAVLATATGKIFAAGSFQDYNNNFAQGFVQLNNDGTIDPNFAPGSSGSVTSAALQPDGKILIAGNLPSNAAIQRLNTDGTVDSTFNLSLIATRFNGFLNCFALQPDGKILIGGEFETVNGVAVGNGTSPADLARINSDGSLDTTFNATDLNNNNSQVTFMSLLPTGQILVHTQLNGLQRINSDGSVDSTYKLAFGDFANAANVTGMTSLPDGSVLLGGSFQIASAAPGSTTSPPLLNTLKLSPTGAIDSSFSPGFNAASTAFLARSNGDIYVGGNFSTDTAEEAVGIVRFSTSPNFLLSPVTVSTGSPVSPGTLETLSATASAVQGQISTVLFQVSTDNVTFTTVAQGTNSSGNLWTASWTPTDPGAYYLRTLATDSLLDTGASAAIANFTVINGAVSPPQITVAPQSQTVALGDSPSFSVTATGSNLTYQWQFNNNPLPNQTAPTLSLSNVTQTQAGSYNVIVSNSAGNLPSAAAILTIQANFSTWEGLYGSAGNPTDTPQNDKLPNLLKYVFDIDPSRAMNATDQQSTPRAGTASDSNGSYLTLTYRQNSLLSGITVNVQTSTDMLIWTTVNPPDFSKQIGTDPNTGDPIMQTGVFNNGSKQFIRLSVPQP